MAITRDAKDVWEEVRQKADKCRESNTPIYTLAENVPNQIIKVEPDEIWRQSRDRISKNGGPSPVSRTEIERIWNAIRQNGEAIEERNATALRFAWALVANFIAGLEFRNKPFRLVVVNEELANRLYVKEETQAGSPERSGRFLILMQHSPDFTKYDDQIGEQYHYPNQYFDRVVEGARFIYCRPQEGASATVYFGTGTIGAIRQDVTKEGHRYCQIEDYFPFPKEVPYREESGIYLETQTSQIPVMQSAVRVISKQAFQEIVQRSNLQEEAGGFLERLRTAESDMDQIRLLNKAYSSAAPKVRQYLTTRVERGTAIGGRVKAQNQYICQVCGASPFLTRTGQPYAEAHHVTPLHKLESGSLASENVICVCPNCHRKMHYGNVELVAADEGSVTFEIEGDHITIRRNRL